MESCSLPQVMNCCVRTHWTELRQFGRQSPDGYLTDLSSKLVLFWTCLWNPDKLVAGISAHTNQLQAADGINSSHGGGILHTS